MNKNFFLLILTCTVYAAFLGELVATSMYYLSKNPERLKANPFFANFDNNYAAQKTIENQLKFLDNPH